MLQVREKLAQAQAAQATLTLPFELRQKSRLRVSLDNGREAGVILPRGSVLRGGDCLRADDGTVIRVEAAAEAVSTAFSADAACLARACYHLGNRHVALQIGDTWLRYLHDHVLDSLVAGLGLRVFQEQAAFEPEAGAYHSHDTPGHGAHPHGAHDHHPRAGGS